MAACERLVAAGETRILVLNFASAKMLGAWGCGVFQNDPKTIVQYFYEHLTQNPRFVNKFRKIVFAIPERSRKSVNFEAFVQYFGS